MGEFVVLCEEKLPKMTQQNSTTNWVIQGANGNSRGGLLLNFGTTNNIEVVSETTLICLQFKREKFENFTFYNENHIDVGISCVLNARV